MAPTGQAPPRRPAARPHSSPGRWALGWPGSRRVLPLQQRRGSPPRQSRADAGPCMAGPSGGPCHAAGPAQPSLLTRVTGDGLDLPRALGRLMS